MRMPLGRTPALLCAALAAAVLAAGCGGSGDEEPSRAPAATVPAGDPLTIDAIEYEYAPSRIALTGGNGPVRQPITLDNRGGLPHDIEIRDGDEVVAKLPVLESGDSDSLTAGLARGSYEFVCTVADHEEKGMTGTIEVR